MYKNNFQEWRPLVWQSIKRDYGFAGSDDMEDGLFESVYCTDLSYKAVHVRNSNQLLLFCWKKKRKHNQRKNKEISPPPPKRTNF